MHAGRLRGNRRRLWSSYSTSLVRAKAVAEAPKQLAESSTGIATHSLGNSDRQHLEQLQSACSRCSKLVIAPRPEGPRLRVTVPNCRGCIGRRYRDPDFVQRKVQSTTGGRALHLANLRQVAATIVRKTQPIVARATDKPGRRQGPPRT
jgi:hypothetical protein